MYTYLEDMAHWLLTASCDLTMLITAVSEAWQPQFVIPAFPIGIASPTYVCSLTVLVV